MSVSVVVDASVWIHFLNVPRSPLGGQVLRLLETERAEVTFLTLAEVLQGAHSDPEFEEILEVFQDVRRIQETGTDWVEAARLVYSRRRHGVSLVLSDALLAVVSLRLGALLLTLDGDFDRVPGLRRMKPEPLS